MAEKTTMSYHAMDREEEEGNNNIMMKEWSSGLCSCFDHCVPNCLLSFFCPCIPLAQMYHRIGLWQYNYALPAFLSLILCGAAFIAIADHTRRGAHVVFTILSIFVSLCVVFVIWKVRVKVRAQYSIPGNSFEDWILSCCCGSCVIAQLARHLKIYTPGECYCGAPNECV